MEWTIIILREYGVITHAKINHIVNVVCMKKNLLLIIEWYDSFESLEKWLLKQLAPILSAANEKRD
jgi:hypothetical protein